MSREVVAHVEVHLGVGGDVRPPVAVEVPDGQRPRGHPLVRLRDRHEAREVALAVAVQDVGLGEVARDRDVLVAVAVEVGDPHRAVVELQAPGRPLGVAPQLPAVVLLLEEDVPRRLFPGPLRPEDEVGQAVPVHVRDVERHLPAAAVGQALVAEREAHLVHERRRHVGVVHDQVLVLEVVVLHLHEDLGPLVPPPGVVADGLRVLRRQVADEVLVALLADDLEDDVDQPHRADPVLAEQDRVLLGDREDLVVLLRPLVVALHLDDRPRLVLEARGRLEQALPLRRRRRALRGRCGRRDRRDRRPLDRLRQPEGREQHRGCEHRRVSRTHLVSSEPAHRRQFQR